MADTLDAPASSASRTVLLVSPQFPPSTLVGAHRARHLAKHLGVHGWRPIVVTVRPEDYEETLDLRLAALVRDDVEIVRTAAIPKHWARRVGIGDIGLRGYAGLRRAILRLLSTARPDLVLITGFPFYPMLVARAIRRRGVPVVLDFQDPWISSWGAERSPCSKAGLAHRIALALEPRAVRAASGIMSVSAEQNQTMQLRYPDIPASRFCDLPIGGDWDDHAMLTTTEPDTRHDFVYAGAFLPRSGDVLAAFFGTLRDMRAIEPERFAQTKFHFIGTAAVTDRNAACVVAPIAAAHGVADLVEETPWRLPYLDALGLMRRARVNLLIGSDEPHYTASKIYPALMSGRPFLSLFHARSSSHAILAHCGGGIALSFEGSDDLAALRPTLREALTRCLDDAEQFGAVDRAAIEPFTAGEIARRCAAFFDRILALEGHDDHVPDGRAAPSTRVPR